MNNSTEVPDLNFFTAFFGLAVAPSMTVRYLLHRRKYHFAVLILALMLVIAFTPMVIRLRTANQMLYRVEILKSFVLASTIGFFLFIFMEALLLRIIGVKLKLAGLVSTICYCTAPLTFMVLCIYVLNYWASGTTHYLTFVLNGYAASSPGCVNAAGWVTFVCFLVVAIVFTYGLKYLGDMYTINAIFLTVLSTIPLFGAFVLSIIIGDAVLPGTSNAYRQLITSPSFILAV